ncbi:chromosome segregation protein SMC [Crassaminicella profunda]|uniref:chromosome segregation protein SMC n=1 Tax=Crassaminicella profunda TaxID=1286698 RepID=UPI001CA77242|nr:chromosome segregation protein SMC [Crassaminicella profunda]QZY57093.1 chromosome segregation protein SMC [Crassaminicella profunda]
MYLKKVDIHGFKSFADKIGIEFEKGVTGIVGPNGSGKSNISDAIRWVLGEQSAKTLRGSRMDDVIFAGTTERKPVGMAEVSLTLDNESNKLPVDYSEVTVTRRVYRSGESEYYLNKSLCRLKDIREIFMDTGVGVDGYSIIGQGRIDEILNNKSGNRRLLFEEAAGIVKYRSRKEESEKKLENTNQNLTRVDDIIRELKLRIEPLKAQSEKAKAFLEVQGELKDLEINLFIHELETLKYDIEALKEQQNIIRNQLNHYSEDKKEIEGEYEETKKNMEEIDASIQQLQNNIFETMHLMEKKEGELGLCNEKVLNITENTKRLNNEIKEIDENKNNLLIQLDEMKDHLKNESEFLEDTKNHLQNKLNDFNQVRNILEKKEEDMEKSKETVIEILNSAATIKSEMHSLITFQNNIIKRQRQIEEEKKNLETHTESLKKEEETVQEQLKKIKNEFENLNEERNFVDLEIEKSNKLMKENKVQEEQFRQRIQEKQTRKKLLEEMEKEYEGFHKSVKNTLIHAKKNPHLGKGIYGVVAELIDVPKGFEVAVEVALGSAMQNIVCERTDDANRVIHYLKKNKLGRVTFLPMDRFKKKILHRENIEQVKGFLGFAIDMIGFSDDYENVVNYLLGKVLFVDKIENGIVLSKRIGNKYKIVSLDGDIINPSGAITGGSYRSKTLNILSRKREIEELGSSIKDLTVEYEEKVKFTHESENKLVDLKQKLNEQDHLLKEKEIAFINTENKKNQLEKEIKNYQESICRIVSEIEQLDMDQLETDKDIKIKQVEIEKLESKEKEIQDKVLNSKSSYEEERTQKEKLSSEVTNVKIKIASLEQKKQHVDQDIKIATSKIKELDGLKNNKQTEINQLIKNKESLLEQLNGLKIEMKDADVLKKQCEFNLGQEKSKRKEVYKNFEEVEENLKKINEMVAELQDSFHKIEVKLTRLEMQQESYFNKLWETYEITYVEALTYKKENINLPESSKRIKVLKKKIRDLGSVNLNAIDEYEEVMERYEFLTVQKEDLTAAIDSLKKVIKEMENTMRTQFAESFEKIRENFDEVFKKLFGGGKAQLKLDDEGDILSSKIEIIAQPPGKKLQNLSLLSGGERALTAIALLFAILKVKPTPFCILDEIEAALDDANVYRYADFLKEFSKETQFIVVTHRKGTMESVDALYGVTMQEHGVSKLVSVKLTEKVS